jgi:hypothetical protein
VLPPLVLLLVKLLLPRLPLLLLPGGIHAAVSTGRPSVDSNLESTAAYGLELLLMLVLCRTGTAGSAVKTVSGSRRLLVLRLRLCRLGALPRGVKVPVWM